MQAEKFISSGGLGDAWIVFLKILPFAKNNKIIWHHTTAHQFHEKSIKELMSLVPNIVEGQVFIVNKESKQQIWAERGTFNILDTKAYSINSPQPDLSFIGGAPPAMKNIAGGYIVIQPAAGRLDNSYRAFSPKAIEQLLHKDKYKLPVYLVGMRYKEACEIISRHQYVSDLTGRTDHVSQVLNLIYHAEEFVGFHGALAYMAQSMRIKSHVIYDNANLLNHYTNEQWNANATHLVYPKYNQGKTHLNDIRKLVKL